MAFDITPLTEQLDALMTETRFETAGGRVLVPKHPIELDPLVAPFYTEEEADEYTSLAFVFMDDVDWSTVLTLDWTDPARPVSWQAEVECLRAGDRAYVMIPPDVEIDQEWVAVAAVEPADHRAAWSAFAEDLLGSRGVAYGAEMFTSWPIKVINHVPELIDETAIARAKSRSAEEHPGW